MTNQTDPNDDATDFVFDNELVDPNEETPGRTRCLSPYFASEIAGLVYADDEASWELQISFMADYVGDERLTDKEFQEIFRTLVRAGEDEWALYFLLADPTWIDTIVGTLGSFREQPAVGRAEDW